MESLSLGVVATSRKPDEHRRALHPAHLERIDPDLRRRIVLEEGYGKRFDVGDAELARLVGGLRPREEVLTGADVVVLPKPEAEDLRAMRPGQALWGWPHCVQNEAITQAAIDRRLTLIAWEAMQHWAADGGSSSTSSTATTSSRATARSSTRCAASGARGPTGGGSGPR